MIEDIARYAGAELGSAEIVTTLGLCGAWMANQYRRRRAELVRRPRRVDDQLGRLSELYRLIAVYGDRLGADTARLITTHNSGNPLDETAVWKSSCYGIWTRSGDRDPAPDLWRDQCLQREYLDEVLIPVYRSGIADLYADRLRPAGQLRSVYDSTGVSQAFAVLVSKGREILYVDFGFTSRKEFTAAQWATARQAGADLQRTMRA